MALVRSVLKVQGALHSNRWGDPPPRIKKVIPSEPIPKLKGFAPMRKRFRERVEQALKSQKGK